jgi:hypothetical protein
VKFIDLESIKISIAIIDRINASDNSLENNLILIA